MLPLSVDRRLYPGSRHPALFREIVSTDTPYASPGPEAQKRELLELQAIYIERGLTKDLARQVRLRQPPCSRRTGDGLTGSPASGCVGARLMC